MTEMVTMEHAPAQDDPEQLQAVGFAVITHRYAEDPEYPGQCGGEGSSCWNLLAVPEARQPADAPAAVQRRLARHERFMRRMFRLSRWWHRGGIARAYNRHNRGNHAANPRLNAKDIQIAYSLHADGSARVTAVRHP